MSATTASDTTLTRADPLHQGHTNDPSQSSDGSVLEQRRVMKVGAVSSPVRSSPRLPCLPPPQPPTDTSSDGESEAINALLISREETPENDAIPPDEPSTVLASRILRAHDNPSPPPQGVTHNDIAYSPEKDNPYDVSAPPSPFRPINLLERLNQLPDPIFDNVSTLALGDRPGISEPTNPPSRGFISPGSCKPFVTSMPMKRGIHEVSSSSIKCKVINLPSQYAHEPVNFTDVAGLKPSSQPATEPHGEPITSFVDSVTFGSSSTQAVDLPLNPIMLPDSNVYSGQTPGPQNYPQSSPGAHNVTALPSPLPNEDVEVPQITEITIAGRQDDTNREISSGENSSPPSSEEQRENKYTKETGASQLLSQSIDVLSNKQMILPAESTCIKYPPATPPRVAGSSITHHNAAIRPLVVAPTPVRANDVAQKLISPSKPWPDSEACRTPAQRVPIAAVLARGTSSFQKTLQLSTEPDFPQLGRLPATRTVFVRPALDDPSRTPAKRVPVTASPSRGPQVQNSPSRFGLRARSMSVEPRPLGSILARSRSVEPCSTISKLDNHEGLKESAFPVVHMPLRLATKLPFPLIPNQKSSNELSSPIPEEPEFVETGNTKTDTTLGGLAQGTASLLRQPSINSRIPRIGNKPYARPTSKDGKATPGATSARTICAPASSFQLAYKSNGVGNADVPSTQPSSDLFSVGSLKRKRGAEATASSNPHPVIIRQVVPGILSGKYAQKPPKIPSQASLEPSPPKVVQPLKFRKVVDGMLSARYAPTKTNPAAQTEPSDSILPPPSPLSELSSSSNEEPSDEKPSTTQPLEHFNSETSNRSRNSDAVVVEPTIHNQSLHQDADGGQPSTHLRRTSRTRKPAQQQYVLDVFNDDTSTRAPRRKPQTRTDGDGFMGMSATALRALTTSNTTKNQQTVAVLATEVIRKEGLRPESPTVKARTVLQKQRDERDMRRKGRAQRRAQMTEQSFGANDAEGPGDGLSLNQWADRDENGYAMSQKHHRGPGDEEDYRTPNRAEHVIEPLRLEGVDEEVKPGKQVKWHLGLSTAVYLDEVDPRPKPLPKNVSVRGCLAPTSKNLPLDPLGNLVDIDNRPSPELVSEQIIVKKYLYDDDVEPEPIPVKVTRSKSRKK